MSPLPIPNFPGLYYMLNPTPSCWLGRGNRVLRRWLQLQSCICVAGILCCSLSMSSIEARNRKRHRKMAAANRSNSFLLGAAGVMLLVPLFLTVPPHRCVKWRHVLHSSGLLQVVGKHNLPTSCHEEQGRKHTALYSLVLSRLHGIFT